MLRALRTVAVTAVRRRLPVSARACVGAAEGPTPGGRRSLFWSAKEDPLHPVPANIKQPSYAVSGQVEPCRDVCLHEDPAEIEALREAAAIAADTLVFAEGLVQPGARTDDIDAAVRDYIFAAGAYPAPLNYAGFPKSCCISVNEVVCHGIPGGMPDGLGREVRDGDVVSIDVSVYTGAGFFGDNCRTYLAGNASEADRGLVEHTRRAMWHGIRACRPGQPLSVVGNAIADYCQAHCLESVERFCGHGIGRAMHMQPMVMHFRNTDTFPLQPGMTFTVEPMVTRGRQDCSILDDGWTVVTDDGSRSAQFEHTVLITDDGFEVLTAYDDEQLEWDENEPL